MLNVVHIQFSSQSAGGAALRIQSALIKAGVNSHIISLQRDLPPADRIIYLGKKQRFIAKLNFRIQTFLTKKNPAKFGLFSYSGFSNGIAHNSLVKQADIIYIHWVQNGFLSLKDLKALAMLNKPIIFFLHDMWGISGGCHYSFNCQNYISGCKNCQMFPDGGKAAEKIYQKKLKLYAEYNNLYFVAPSKWLYNCTKQSLLTKDKPVYYIPNLLDNSIFKPYSKTVARQILDINENETVIAFGAVSITSPYKGWLYLQQALMNLSKKVTPSEKITILIFGSGYNKQIADLIPFKTKFMGYLSDEYATALVYNAADVFIAPSVAEAFGYVIFEALNCGTPVVGFNVGGIPDMIKHKQNGYLAKLADAEDIVKGVQYCLENNLKGFVPDELNTENTLNKHLELFSQITSLGR